MKSLIAFGLAGLAFFLFATFVLVEKPIELSSRYTSRCSSHEAAGLESRRCPGNAVETAGWRLVLARVIASLGGMMMAPGLTWLFFASLGGPPKLLQKLGVKKKVAESISFIVWCGAIFATTLFLVVLAVGQ